MCTYGPTPIATHLALIVCVLLHPGCAHRRSDVAEGVRFANAPIVWAVSDRMPIPKPKTHPFWDTAFKLRQSRVLPLTHALSVRDRLPAQNTNALGEVPDSTWFYNRIGRRSLTPADIAAGPAGGELPRRGEPWVIVEGKLIGGSAGFVVENAAGVKFLVKFDLPDVPETESAHEVITQRLLWALGYHTPINEVVYLDPTDLRIGDGATTQDKFNHDIPFTQQHLAAVLARAAATEDGTYRAFVSQFLPGEPLGGYAGVGVRDDDPNDRVPHQHRRDLRAQFVFFGWLAHTDIKPPNRLDMWVEDPQHRDRHFVMHYLLDFGKSLGAFGPPLGHPSDTYAYGFDYQYSALSLLGLGLWKRPWEGDYERPHPLLGRIDVTHFRPGKFKPGRPYEPFFWFDAIDGWWAVKTMLRLSPAHIRAAVLQGKFSDPKAVELLTAILVGRQRKAARYFLRRLNPVGDVVLRSRPDGQVLCAEDLWIHYRLDADRAPSGHGSEIYDYEGRSVRGFRASREAKQGWFCTPPLPTTRSTDRYTIVALSARRGDEMLPTVWVHLAAAPGREQLRIIGMHHSR